MTRAYISLNGEWTFHGPNGSVEQVNIPHTWNGKDGQDGGCLLYTSDAADE